MIRAAYTGPERVELNGAVHTGPNAEGDLARALIGVGVEPAELLVFERDGVPQLRGTVGAFAARAYPGGEAQATRWAPHPKGNYPFAVLRWHAQTAPKGSRGRVGRVGPEKPPTGNVGDVA